MAWYDSISLKQARSDLKYLQDTYGPPQDFCGTFCNNEILEGVMFGSVTIKEAVIRNIEYYFSNGLQRDYAGCSSNVFPDKDDRRVQKILERYLIESDF